MRAAPPDRLALWGAVLLAAVAITVGIGYGACTQDDAFISFRYAEHLVRGEGLVFNPGEHVEGYTNLSWTLALAFFMALGAEPVVTSILMGLAALAAGVAVTARVGVTRGWPAALAAAFVALDPLLVLEAVEGLETVFFMTLSVSALALAVRGRDRAAGGVLALACLTRPEGVLLSGLIYVGLCLDALVRGRGFWPQLRRGLVAAVPVVATLGLLTLWRLGYYGDPLPNTFYAKTGGLAIERGLRYLWWHARARPLLYGLVAARLLMGRWSRDTLPAAVLAVGYLAYVVSVGGDFKPTGRFIIPVIPAMGLLAAEAAEQLQARLPARLPAVPLAAAGLLAYTMVTLLPVGQAVAQERHANLEARRLVGEWVNTHTPRTAVIAIHSAGVVPFYADRTTIDMWGLTDRHIARTEPDDFGSGLAGHEKTDPVYVFSRSPDLYLPEDKLFTLRPQPLEPAPNFPADFEERYRQKSIPIEGRWLNLWIRREFAGGVWGR